MTWYKYLEFFYKSIDKLKKLRFLNLKNYIKIQQSERREDMEQLRTRYYTVKQIKQLEGCGKDQAYKIANGLPHEKRGKQIFVFAEDYDNYYQEKRENALKSIKKENFNSSNFYQVRKFN